MRHYKNFHNICVRYKELMIPGMLKCLPPKKENTVILKFPLCPPHTEIDPVLILVCFVNSLFKYIQTAFQFLGQRYSLVKTSRVFSQCDNPKFPFCFLWQLSFPALQSVRRLGPQKKGKGENLLKYFLEIRN